MKNKFLCLLLCAFLVIGGIIFSACGIKGYDLKKFNNDYLALANQEGVSVNEQGYLEFDFIQIYNAIVARDGNPANDPCATSLATFYAPLTNQYAYLTKNSQNFIVYVKEMLSAGNDASKQTRNNIQSQLKEVSSSLNNVQNKIKDYVRVISITTSQNTLDRQAYFNNLTNALCGFYNSCRNLSFSVANVFFNDILNNENYNFYSNANNYSVKLTNTLPDITNFQVFNLTQNFVEMYVEGNDKAINEEAFTSYKNSVESLINYTAELKGKKIKETEEVYKNVLAMYALNGKLINERNMHLNATNNVVYLEVLQNGASNQQEQASMNIIAGYKQNLDDLTNALVKILQSTEAI